MHNDFILTKMIRFVRFIFIFLQVMLTALQAQVELGDGETGVMEYRQVSCHCLPSRLLTNVPNDDVAMHHQSLRGMSSAEAKKAFLNLIKSWPLHRATIFDVMVCLRRCEDISESE